MRAEKKPGLVHATLKTPSMIVRAWTNPDGFEIADGRPEIVWVIADKLVEVWFSTSILE